MTNLEQDILKMKKAMELLLKQVSATKIFGADEKMKYKNKTISKRKDGRWFCRYYVDGKQISVYGQTQQECLHKLKVALASPNAKSTKKTSQYTLARWIDEWFALFKIDKVRKSTLSGMQARIKLYVLSNPIAQLNIKEITAIDIQELLNNIKALRQREHIHGMLKDCLTKALKMKLIKDDLFMVITLPRRTKKHGSCLTADQELKFRKACNTTDVGDYYLFTLATGMRKGEARAITINDIDFDNKIISINKSLSKANEIDLPKAGERTIPLFAEAESIALKYKDVQGRIFKFGATKVQKHFREMCDNINLKHITIHDLRHTFCTRCMELGVPVEQTSQWAGHSDIKITQAYYIHINKEFEQKNIAIKNKGF